VRFVEVLERSDGLADPEAFTAGGVAGKQRFRAGWVEGSVIGREVFEHLAAG